MKLSPLQTAFAAAIGGLGVLAAAPAPTPAPAQTTNVSNSNVPPKAKNAGNTSNAAFFEQYLPDNLTASSQNNPSQPTGGSTSPALSALLGDLSTSNAAFFEQYLPDDLKAQPTQGTGGTPGFGNIDYLGDPDELAGTKTFLQTEEADLPIAANPNENAREKWFDDQGVPGEPTGLEPGDPAYIGEEWKKSLTGTPSADGTDYIAEEWNNADPKNGNVIDRVMPPGYLGDPDELAGTKAYLNEEADLPVSSRTTGYFTVQGQDGKSPASFTNNFPDGKSCAARAGALAQAFGRAVEGACIRDADNAITPVQCDLKRDESSKPAVRAVSSPSGSGGP